jgi:hypothetical protein
MTSSASGIIEHRRVSAGDRDVVVERIAVDAAGPRDDAVLMRIDRGARHRRRHGQPTHQRLLGAVPQGQGPVNAFERAGGRQAERAAHRDDAPHPVGVLRCQRARQHAAEAVADQAGGTAGLLGHPLQHRVGGNQRRRRRPKVNAGAPAADIVTERGQQAAKAARHRVGTEKGRDHDHRVPVASR